MREVGRFDRAPDGNNLRSVWLSANDLCRQPSEVMKGIDIWAGIRTTK